jgi:hypothetical protein
LYPKSTAACTNAPFSETSFVDIHIGDRTDIQRLLRTQIEVLDDDLYVLTEEFGDWEDSIAIDAAGKVLYGAVAP